MGDAALAGLLKSEFEGLSPQLQEAARWMIDHPADVALLTTREQARRAGVAPATMTRLAQRIGLKGYDEVRKLYAEAVRRRPESFRARAAELLQRRDSAGETGVDLLRTIGAADVMLAISVKPYTRHTIHAVRYSRARGVRIVAVTDSEMSPLAALAEETLIVRTETPSFFHTMAPAFA